jgi:hypothetical protein
MKNIYQNTLKLILLPAVLFLVGCAPCEQSPDWKDLNRYDQVMILTGSFSGQAGSIEGRSFKNHCGINAFEIKLRNTGDIVSIDQNSLEKIN